MSKLIDIDGAKVIWEHVKKADAEVEKKADTNATAISTETARAKSAESSNATAIANEITRAKTAETANAEAIAKNSDALGGHTIASDVPENAVFTDTVYDDTALTKRVTALEGKEDKNTTYTFSDDKATDSAGKTQAVTVTKVNGHTVNSDVPEGAVFTDTVYDDTAVKNRLTALEDKSTGSGKTYTFTDDTATDSDGNAQAVTVTKVNGHTIEADVPSDARFEDYVTLDYLEANDYYPELMWLVFQLQGIQSIDYATLKGLITQKDDEQMAKLGISLQVLMHMFEAVTEQIDANTSSISSKADSATTLSGYGITDAYTKSETDTALAKKQDKLTYDSEPTKDSTNAITSGGVYKALNGEITVTTQNDNLLDPNDTDNQVAKKIFYTSSSSTQFISLSGDTAIYFPVKKWGAGTYTFPVDYVQYGGSAAYRIALFDASKTYIKTITGTAKDTTDKTAHIMSISVTKSDLSTGYYIGLSIRTTQIGTSAMVVKDMDYPSSYVSYGTTTKTYKTQKVDNELVGKSAYYLGDSICAATSVGSASSLYKKGWAGWIGEKNSMNWVNLGKDGATVSTVSTNTVIAQMSSVKSDADYIIVEGGCNDFDQMNGSTDSAKMGALTAVWDDSYAQNTYIGALEHVFYTLVTDHPNAKIGYIIPHIMGRRNWTQYETISYRIYYNQAIEVCKKWGIPYIDLWYESPLNPNLTVYYDASLGNDGNISDGSKAYVDGQHLTGHGYDLISPKIEAWMRTL